MTDYTNELQSTIDDCGIDTDPDEMDADDLVSAYGATERLRGMLQVIAVGVKNSKPTSAEGSRTSRLQDAWATLRGRDPVTGRDWSTVRELERTHEESADAVDDRAEALQERLIDHLDGYDTGRGMFR